MLPNEIRTERLVLRPFSLGDAAAVFAYSNEPDWARYQRLPDPWTPEAAERQLAERVLRDRATNPSWALTLEGAVIGIVGLDFHAEHRIAQLGYGVHKPHWGKGFAREASQAVLDLAFRAYTELARVRAHIDARNRASIRVLEKLGFTHEGTLRSNQFGRGEFVDEAIYGLLREEWRD